MASTSTCPDRESLTRLLLGQVADAEADVLEQHMGQCEQCLETTRSLRLENDTLLQAVRTSAKAEPLESDEAADRLIARICQMTSLATDDTPCESATLTGDQPLTPRDATSDRALQEICAGWLPRRGPASWAGWTDIAS